MTVVSIASDRIEIGRVVGLGQDHWLMCVVETDNGQDCYAEQYPTRETATAAALEWGLPVHYVNEIGTILREDADFAGGGA